MWKYISFGDFHDVYAEHPFDMCVAVPQVIFIATHSPYLLHFTYLSSTYFSSFFILLKLNNYNCPIFNILVFFSCMLKFALNSSIENYKIFICLFYGCTGSSLLHVGYL